MPPELKQWLDAELVRRGFSNYVQLAKDLKARGGDSGKSAIHRYGAHLEAKLQAIKDSTDAAVLINKAAPDDAGMLGAATIAFVQTAFFNVMVALKELENAGADANPAERVKLLARVAKAVTEMSRAGVSQKKHELGLRAQIAQAQKTITTAAKKSGASADLIKLVEQQLGIIR